MANITIQNSPQGYNLTNFSLIMLKDFFYWQNTATNTVFSSNTNNDGTGFDPSVTGVFRLEVLGTNLADNIFADTPKNTPFQYTAGTIDAFNFIKDGVKLITATNVDLDALGMTQTLLNILTNSAPDTTLSLILQHADKITGGVGADTINGMGDNDTLMGGRGNDSLLGGDGNDRINGQNGADKLTGGAGADIFVFDSKPKSGVDTIRDFTAADDQFALENAVYTKIGKVGTLKAGAYVEGTKAKDAGDRIIYNEATGKIFYDADGSGKGKAVLFAQVTAGTDLSAADFSII